MCCRVVPVVHVGVRRLVSDPELVEGPPPRPCSAAPCGPLATAGLPSTGIPPSTAPMVVGGVVGSRVEGSGPRPGLR
jgi:hypothetical protein